MRKLIALTIALTVIAAAVPAEAGFGIKVKGGYTYISYSDWNTYVDETNKQIPSGIPTFSNINWLPEISLEFIFPLFSDFSGAVGIGYLSGKSDYSFDSTIEIFSDLHEVKSVPVLLNFYWEPLPVSVKPFVYGGVGFYRMSIKFDRSVTSGANSRSATSEMDKWGFGLQGGGGVSISLFPKVSVDIGIQGRWADISGFEGTATDQDGKTVDVYLASYKGYFGPEEKNAGEPEGSVNLSGYSIFIGLTIGL